MSNTDISVVIPSFGRRQAVRNCVEALSRQSARERIREVIVVDDGSPDPLREEDVRSPIPVTLLRQPNAGPAAARNRALQEAGGTLCWFLNDDAVPSEDCLSALLDAHAPRRPGESVLGRFDFAPSTQADAFMRMVREGTMMFAYERIRENVANQWRFFWTCNLLVDMESVRTAGAFDAQTFGTLWGVEDVELGYRLERRAGRAVHYCPAAACNHDHVMAPKSYFSRQYGLGRNLFRMYRKHDDPNIIYMAEGTAYTARSHALIGRRVREHLTEVETARQFVCNLFASREAAPADEDEYFRIVRRYAQEVGVEIMWAGIHREAQDVFGKEDEEDPPCPGKLSAFGLRLRCLERSIRCLSSMRSPRLKFTALPMAAPETLAAPYDIGV